MFLDGLWSDGETEARAALFGREVWKEETLAHLVGEAGAGVGNGELDHAAFDKGGEDAKFAEEALLHSLGSIVDEVAEGALERFRVCHDQGKIWSHLADNSDALHAS